MTSQDEMAAVDAPATTHAPVQQPAIAQAPAPQTAPTDYADELECILRPMRWWDIPPVMVLELDAFGEDAWTVGMFWSELAEAASRRYVVAEEYGFDPAHPDRDGPRIVGYAGLMIGAGEAEVQTIAVDRRREGRGVGTRLLSRLLADAARGGCDEVLLEVREDNYRAQALYHRFGFELIGLRPKYYQPSNTDALVMRAVGVAARFGGRKDAEDGRQHRNGRIH